MVLQSMTGFGSLSGQLGGVSWIWEIRSVNGRGLDVRVRVPEGADVLEPLIRASVPKRMKRGNVSINLKYSRGSDETGPVLNIENLSAVIAAAAEAQKLADAQGVDTVPVSAGELLAQKWVWEVSQTANLNWIKGAKAQIDDMVARLAEAREDEGRAIGAILTAQIDTLTKLSAAARNAAQERNARAGGVIREKVLALLEVTELADEGRLAQELATIAVKADVMEELDRLDAHVAAARALLGEGGAIGRKFDFLMQEFNREANTLCSKSGSTDLTTIGLELKVVIDQMREQVQNLE